MHIAEGALSAPVLAGGGLVATFLRRVRPELLMAPLRLARAEKMAQP